MSTEADPKTETTASETAEPPKTTCFAAMDENCAAFALTHPLKHDERLDFNVHQSEGVTSLVFCDAEGDVDTKSRYAVLVGGKRIHPSLHDNSGVYALSQDRPYTVLDGNVPVARITKRVVVELLTPDCPVVPSCELVGLYKRAKGIYGAAEIPDVFTPNEQRVTHLGAAVSEDRMAKIHRRPANAEYEW